MKIYLVSCVNKKHDGVHAAKYVEQHLEKGDKWFILSAKYGLVSPETQIEKYDKTLNKMYKADRYLWATKAVIPALEKELDSSTEIVFLAGKNYTEFLTQYLDTKKVKYTDLLKGKKIGERLSFLS